MGRTDFNLSPQHRLTVRHNYVNGMADVGSQTQFTYQFPDNFYVIKDTTKQTLPPGFQTSEFLLKHGLIDQIVSRTDLRDRLGEILLALYVKKKARAANTAA